MQVVKGQQESTLIKVKKAREDAVAQSWCAAYICPEGFELGLFMFEGI